MRKAHNPEVAGSNPDLAPATMKTRLIDGFFVYRHLRLVGCNIVLMKIRTYSSTGILILFILIGEQEIN